MATTRSFQDMLNEYLPNSLLKEELIRRDYFLSNIKKDNNWKGGDIPVPFKANGASSIRLGGLTASNDIAQSRYVRGKITSYKEAWGSMIFNHTDLMQHDGKIKESTFLRILPDTIEDFMIYMKEVMSHQIGSGGAFGTVLGVAGIATGTLLVDRVERFVLDQKVQLHDVVADTYAAYYVTAIDLNGSFVTFSATRGGAGANLTGLVAINDKFYHDGGEVIGSRFNSIRSSLLSSANGGSASLHGITKASYPYLQGINIDGSGVTGSNILERIFDGYVDIRTKARGMADTVVMSYKNWANCVKTVESVKGGFKVTPDSEKASIYGWDEIEIMAIGKGGKRLKLVAVQEWDNDVIAYIDWSGMTFRSNGFFRKRTAPDGKQYFEMRGNDSGYQYILDTCVFGELEMTKPNTMGIIHTIDY